MTLTIQIPEKEEDLNEVRQLMRSFVNWHRENHPQNDASINEYFDSSAFENELTTLPGKYTPPGGQLLYASWDSRPAGCVAMHELEPGCCEMKRMFVYPEFHGKGIGRSMAERLLEQARAMKFGCMRLDTSIDQIQALGLYRSLGFVRIEPYYDVPEKLRNWLVFMELEL